MANEAIIKATTNLSSWTGLDGSGSSTALKFAALQKLYAMNESMAAIDVNKLSAPQQKLYADVRAFIYGVGRSDVLAKSELREIMKKNDDGELIKIVGHGIDDLSKTDPASADRINEFLSKLSLSDLDLKIRQFRSIATIGERVAAKDEMAGYKGKFENASKQLEALKANNSDQSKEIINLKRKAVEEALRMKMPVFGKVSPGSKLERIQEIKRLQSIVPHWQNKPSQVEEMYNLLEYGKTSRDW
ncbi:MAG: hypothetical protein LBO08_00455 [Rickettsiales bacterium]|nr:hypothetical protein [Rickettsiales bacterium]